MISDIDKGWIAGIIDGEGYIGLPKGTHSFRGMIIIANTNPIICSRIKRILDELLVSYSIGFQQPEPIHKVCGKITIFKHSSLERLLIIITPLVCKSEQASLLYSWVRRKMENKIQRSTEWEIYEKMRALNHKGV
jgi:hypothetical protein